MVTKERGKKMENVYRDTMQLLKKYHIHANKKLGQNFLIEDTVVEKTIEAADITKEDLVIEIGPGLGTLTKELLEKAKKVIAVELDEKMIPILQERFFLYQNLELVHQDILKVPLKEYIEKEENIREVKIVANLPYYITTPIIMKLLEDRLPVKTITVMVQKEVAKRLTAKTGDKLCGAITYGVEYYCETKEVVEVPRQSFIPAPEVDSEVIQLILRDKSKVQVKDEKFLFSLIKASFMQRRKTLLNGIGNSGLIEKNKLKEIMQELNLPETTRGENLTLEQFAEIAQKV